MPELKGGCLCGAVRYAVEADQAAATVCHCRDCQKFTGSAFAALVAVEKAVLTMTGPFKTHAGVGGSGKPILRHFCSECGSSLAEEPGTRPGMVILCAGTLDEPAIVAPAREIFRDDAFSWVEIHGDMPRYDKRPS
ncbi:MAG TPA: GFA family protein [Stellaceae bacterium]|nr:GFA family protein [Stellaceae bacterium]